MYRILLEFAFHFRMYRIGGPVMTEFYGDVLYILNDDQLQVPNAWGSTAAPGDDGGAVLGSTYLRIARQLLMDGFEESASVKKLDPRKLAAAQEIMSDQIILSSDWIKFNEYLTILSIRPLKNKDEIITALLNENDRMKFWSLVNKLVLNGGINSTEMHYDGKIPLNDVKSITISSTIKDMLVESCPSDYDTYKDKIIIDNNTKK